MLKTDSYTLKNAYEFDLEDLCSYLENKTQFMRYKYINTITAKESQELIERGYRRFGEMYFRPECPHCDACQSIKIDVENFNFSKSHKRVLKKAIEFKIIIQKPSLSTEHLSLFKKYHLHMKDKKSWKYNEITPQNYYDSFVKGEQTFGKEVLYFYQNRLIGVDLIDILPEGISSIYFYYDPDFSKYSLGKLSLLQQIQYAKRSKLKWIYLGYYVQECASLSYKSEYKPYLTLEGRPPLSTPFKWN